MIVAVTGASGFIGKEIARQATGRGHEVRSVLHRDTTPQWKGLSFVGDVTTGAGLTDAFRGADIVIHAAGLAHQHSGAEAADFAAINADACGRVVRIAAECGTSRVVILSSVSVYGGTTPSTMADETRRPHPSGAYGESKLRGEIIARAEAARTGIALRILRLATVYGAGDPGNVIRLIRTIHRRRFIHIGNGRTRKSMIHRSDAARACLDVGDDSSSVTHCLNVVGGTHTIHEIVSVISKIVGVPVLPFRIPYAVATAGASLLRATPGRCGQIGRSIERWLSDEAYTAAALEQLYGFRPRVSLEQGLTEEIEWYRRCRALTA